MESRNTKVNTDTTITTLLYAMIMSLKRHNAPIKISTKQKDKVSIETNMWEPLDKYINRTGFLEYHMAHRLAICLGNQLSALTELDYGLAFINLSDIVVIDSDWFILTNFTHVMPLVDGSMIKIVSPLPSSDFFDVLVAPELTSIKKLPIKVDQSCAFYNIGSLCLLAMGLNTTKPSMSTIYPSPLYFLIERCLVKEPNDRVFLHI